MNKLDCEIVQDLLPNYVDKLTSEYTNQAMDEHLKSCISCSEMYEKMKENIADNDDIHKEKQRISVSDGVVAFFRKTRKRAFCKGVILMAILSGLLAAIFCYNEYWQKFRVAVPPEDINCEAYRLPDGGIYMTLTVPENYRVSGWGGLREDNIHYFSAQVLYKPALTNLLNDIFYPDAPDTNQMNWYFSEEELENEVTKIVYREGYYDYQTTHREKVLYDGTQKLPLMEEMPEIQPYESWSGYVPEG